MQSHDMIERSLAEDGVAPRSDFALACLLDYAHGASVALPIHSGVELIEQPRIASVPGVPDCCLGLIPWQGRQLPLIDLHRYLNQLTPDRDRAPVSGHVLVVAYQTDAGKPIEYGALCAPFLVRMVEVTNKQQCAPEPGDTIMFSLAISYFLHQGRATPIIEPARLFSRPLSFGAI